jgi:Flp pilus assembly protein TadD
MKKVLILVPALLCLGCAARKIPNVNAQQYNMDRQAVNAVDSGDGDYELKALRAKLDANPADLSVRLELAQRYQKLGFYEVAIEHCRLACERAPDSDEAHIGLAKALRADGRAAEGAKILTDYSKHHEGNVSVWAWLGLLQDSAGEWKAGEAAYRKAVALAPGRDDLHNNLGYCLLRQNKKKEAIEEFQQALKINPGSVMATNNLAAALGSSSKKEAVQRLQSVTDPATAHSNMAAVLIEAGEYEAAREEIDLALSYNHQHSAALNNLRLVSQLDGQPAQVKLNMRASEEKTRGKLARVWRRIWVRSEPANRNNNDNTGTTASSR